MVYIKKTAVNFHCDKCKKDVVPVWDDREEVYKCLDCKSIVYEVEIESLVEH